MVVAYRMGRLSYAIISRLLHTRYVALPNLLAGRELVPEFIQDKAEAKVLASAVLAPLNSTETQRRLGEEFSKLHQSLRLGAGARAAEAILAMPELKFRVENGPL